VKDSRPLIAIALIMVIAFLPSLLMKRPAPLVAPVNPTVVTDSLAAGQASPAAGAPATDSATPSQVPATDSALVARDTMPAVVEDTVVVRSELYQYRISTRGGRIVSARFLGYRSMNPSDTAADGSRQVLELIPAGSPMLDDRLVTGGDTVRFAAAGFTASADELVVADGPATLTLTGTIGSRQVQLDYTFSPADYRIVVTGRATGLGAAGGTLLVGLGNGFRDTESNTPENHRESGIVTYTDDTDLTRFSSLDPLVPSVLSGPFDWVAVKSKYFVAGYFAFDTSRTQGTQGLIGGVVALPADSLPSKPVRARTHLTMPVGSAGTWGATLYLGPMEYDRLSALGREFDDVNPYGWPGFRTVIRPFAVAIRTAFVWMHQTLGLHYGLAIIAFGILIRLLLWPLNQKAMRSMTAMQAIQPEMQAIQKRHKEDPQRLQQEMLKLYKEHKVNPFGGCWPMLIPYPFLIAVFFVLQNTIELRGVEFLWMPDLSRADPLYIIPVFMALSMFGLSKIGQMGIAPNPQAKMMMYVLPVVFGVMFANFASGLNLYYAVQNVASIPQQWLIMKERKKLGLHARTVAPEPVKKKR
jgi:YidC/Oxa1 family membrane protein insertase